MDTGIKGSFLRTVFEGGGSGLFIIWLLAYSTLLQGVLTDFSGGTSFLLVALLTAIQVMASLLYLAGVRHQLALLWLVTTALQTVYLAYLWIAVSQGIGQGLVCLYALLVNGLLFIPGLWFARRKDVF